MLVNKTKGIKSTEFLVTAVIFLLGSAVILTELCLYIFVGHGMGVNIEIIFGILTSSGFFYKTSRTVTKSRSITGMNNKHKVDGEIRKSRSNYEKVEKN